MTMPHTLSTYRKRAKELLRSIKAGDQAAIQRLRATSASLATASDADTQAAASLMRCQHVIAVEQGAQDWSDLLLRLGEAHPTPGAHVPGEDLVLGHGSRWNEAFDREVRAASRVSLGRERCAIPPGQFPRHLAVLGDCGLGKSTFLRRLTLQAMRRRDASIIVIASKPETAWAELCHQGQTSRRALSVDHLETGGWDSPGATVYLGAAMRDPWGTAEATSRIVAAMTARPPQRECWVIIDEPLLDLPVSGAGTPWVDPKTVRDAGDQQPRLPSDGRMHLVTCSQMEPDRRAFHQPDAYLMFGTRHSELVDRIHDRAAHRPRRSAVTAVLSDAPLGVATLVHGADAWVINATGDDAGQLSNTTWTI